MSIYWRTTFVSLLLAFCCGSSVAEDLMIVSQSEATRAAKEKVAPEYPSMAKQLRLEGSVKLKAFINEDGTVDDVKPLTGNAVLMNAAIAAVKRWKFTPFTMEGRPVRATADMSFSFHM